MAFRIPLSSLNEAYKLQIRKDLGLKEKANFFMAKNKFAKGKQIDFFHLDPVTNDVLLPMYYAECLFRRPLINQYRNLRLIPGFNMKTQLRDHQVEIVDIALQNYMKRGTNFINVYCSYGKTVVGAYFSALFSQQHGLITLVIFHRKAIMNSWIDTFSTLTDAKIHVVGETPGVIGPDVQVILSMDLRMGSIPPEVRARVGHFVIDEVDCFCTGNHVERLLSVEPLFITALSATYERDDGFEKMIDLMVGEEKITRISTKPFFVIRIPTGCKPIGEQGKMGLKWMSIVEELDNMIERTNLIIQIVLDNLNEKIMILCTRVEKTILLENQLRMYLEGTGKTVSRYSEGITNYQDADILVATGSKAGVGFDEKANASNWGGHRINFMIADTSIKKPEQKYGRAFRADFPVITEIMDDHKNIRAHAKLREKWCKERNGHIYTVEGRFIWTEIGPQLVQNYFDSLQNGGQVELVSDSIKMKPQLTPQEELHQQHLTEINSYLQK